MLHYCVHNSPQFFPNLSQINLVHTLPPYLFKIPSTPRFPNNFRSSDQTSVCISHLSHLFHLPVHHITLNFVTLITFNEYYKLRSSPVTSLMGPRAGVAKSNLLLLLDPSVCHQPLHKTRHASFTGPSRYRHDPGQYMLAVITFRSRNWFHTSGIIITCRDWTTNGYRIMLTSSESSRPSYRRKLRAHTSSYKNICPYPRHKGR